MRRFTKILLALVVAMMLSMSAVGVSRAYACDSDNWPQASPPPPQ